MTYVLRLILEEVKFWWETYTQYETIDQKAKRVSGEAMVEAGEGLSWFGEKLSSLGDKILTSIYKNENM